MQDDRSCNVLDIMSVTSRRSQVVNVYRIGGHDYATMKGEVGVFGFAGLSFIAFMISIGSCFEFVDTR